jgi:hypothetical protein
MKRGILALATVVLIMGGAAIQSQAQTDSKFVGCWTFKWVDPDDSANSRKLIIKRDGTADEPSENGTNHWSWKSEGSEIILWHADAFPAGETPRFGVESGREEHLKYDGTKLRGWYFNDKGDSPDNIRYYASKDSRCAETDSGSSSAASAGSGAASGQGNSGNSLNTATNVTATGVSANPSVQVTAWVSDGVGDFKLINIRNDSNRTVRVSRLQVYNCQNVTSYTCSERTYNIVLSPGQESNLTTLTPDDIVTKRKDMKFTYKYFADYMP